MNEITCISPIDGNVFATRNTLSLKDAKDEIQRLRAAQSAWSARPLSERISLVMAGVEAIGRMNDQIVPELAKMMGRPVRYSGEFGGFHERAQYMSDIAADALKDIEISDDSSFKRYIRRVPHGIVFVIAPWNYPYMTAINTIAPALIAGNVVALKHATQTLLVGERLVEAFRSAGVPKDVFVNLFLDHDTTSQLIEENEFDEFLPTQGSYPPHIKQPLVKYIPLDKTYTGISIDSGRMYLSVILENNGKKTLLALDMNWIENKNFKLQYGCISQNGELVCGNKYK